MGAGRSTTFRGTGSIRRRSIPSWCRSSRRRASSSITARAYAHHLCLVFADDPEFQETARRWGEEEVQHGRALARWAALADPAFDFDAAFARFQEGFRVDFDSDRSRRGSRCRRDGGALRRRDRHQLLLQRAARCGRGAGIAGDLPPYRRRRAAALPAVLQKPRPLSGAGAGSGGWAGCASRSAASPNWRTTNSPTPITPRTRPTGPTTAAATAGPTPAAPMRFTGRTMSSAASRCC